MKNCLPVLALLIFCSCSVAAQSKVKPDSIISIKTRKILGNRFEFSLRSDYENHSFLQIINLDNATMKPLREDMYFKGGDCNISSSTRAAYEVKKDTLLIYSKDEVIEHFDDTHPHSHSSYTIHAWVFRKSGEIVSVWQKSSRKHPEVEEEVRMKVD
jgi:hypothetical protein